MNDNPTTVPSEANVTSEEGVNVGESQGSGQELLNKINEATGRNYTSLEEAMKGVQETYKFVGSETIAELRRKAQEFDKLKRRPLEGTEKAEEFYRKVDRMEFLLKYPDAEPIADLVGAIAREKGISWFEAYETTEAGKKLQKFVEREKKEREAARPSFIQSGQRLPEGQMAISPEEFSRLSLEEQRKIVEKLPGWNKEIPKTTFGSKKRSSNWR
jgi:hypothetical protein